LEGSISLHGISGGPVKQGVPDSKPLANTTFVVKQGDLTITSFTTDDQGRFRISLPSSFCCSVRCHSGTILGERARLACWRWTPVASVGIALVMLIPFLRKLITDKTETLPAETPATVVPVAWKRLFTVEHHIILDPVGKVTAAKFDEVFKKTRAVFVDWRI
jgi:hypothetical protein